MQSIACKDMVFLDPHHQAEQVTLPPRLQRQLNAGVEALGPVTDYSALDYDTKVHADACCG